MRGVKKKAEWKNKKNDIVKVKVEGSQFKSKLERIYIKEQKEKEWNKVKISAKKETLGGSQLTKNIHSIVMNRLKR